MNQIVPSVLKETAFAASRTPLKTPLAATFLTAAMVMAFATASAPLHAQTPVQPQERLPQSELEYQRQREAEERLRRQMETQPDVRLPIPVTDDPANARLPEERPCVTVDALELDVRPAALSDHFATLKHAAARTADGIADDYTGRCLGAQGINILMRRLQNALIERGYVTSRVGAPEQDLGSGTLKLAIIAGRVRDIRFTADSSPRAYAGNALPLSPGNLLDLRDLEQGLENFKRLSTVDANIQIVPADGADGREGESDLLIDWRQRSLWRLMANADNSGTRTTGRYQAGLTLAGEHLLALNDLIYLNYNQSIGSGPTGARGTRGATLHYSLPIGYWLLSATTSGGTYRQTVVGAWQSYLYSGETRTDEIKLARLFQRDATSKSTAWLRAWRRASKNFIDDTEVRPQRRTTAGWELGGSHVRSLGRLGLESHLAYRQGVRMLGATPAPEEAYGEGTARMRLITFEARANLPFQVGTQQFRALTSLRGQHNLTPLIPQDRFFIGGRSSVRAYDAEHMLAGDRGLAWRGDLGWILGGQEIYLGFDHARVAGPSTRYLADRRLSGAAIGLRGNWQGLSYDVFWGKPIRTPAHFNAPSHVFGINIGFEIKG